MSTAEPVDQLVVIGASAGGIEALSVLSASLPQGFPAPIVVAQHLDPSRPSHLEQILSRRSTLPVRTVRDRMDLEPGVLFVVPADRHVTISDHDIKEGRQLALHRGRATTCPTRASGQVGVQDDGTGHPKPSIDLLFSTAAAAYGDRLIAVVLTGMGSDG